MSKENGEDLTCVNFWNTVHIGLELNTDKSFLILAIN